MDQKKTGRLISKRRREMGLTQEQLSFLLLVTPTAVSAWETGKNHPDEASQIMIEKVMDLNPVELITGVRMYDEKTKKEISAHMTKVDEDVFTGGIARDEDGNESYLDMSGFMVVTGNENGEPSDKWIPYLEYYNAEPHIMTEREKELKAMEDAIPKRDYDPMKIYINCGSAIFVISKEILEEIGKPKLFSIVHSDEEEWVGIKFDENGYFDIPDEVYEGYGTQGEVHGNKGPCRGLMIEGGEFGKALCRQMGIRRMRGQMVVTPTYIKEKNLLIIDLIEAKRVKTIIDSNCFALPTCQFEEEIRIMEEEDEEVFEE